MHSWGGGGVLGPSQANAIIFNVRAIWWRTIWWSDLELRADTWWFLLLVEVKQRLGDAVMESQVAEVLQ